MKSVVLEKKFIAALLLGTAFLAGCGDDDDFAPVARDRGYDYALKSTSEFADYPCNDVREGREAVVGRDKESYYCQFDYRDSVYIWAGYDDTLTATGKEFVRRESSSSSRGSSSSRSSSSYSSSSSSSSSSYYRSSSSISIYVQNYSSSNARNKTYKEKDEYVVKWPESKDGFLNPEIEYGTMTDPRDGKTYKTVEFHGQIWMAENLNFADSTLNPLLKEGKSVCFKNEESNCELLGRLYSRMAAMNTSSCDYKMYCNLGSDPIQGVCPSGWHLPTRLEMEDLAYFNGRSAQWLMSTKYGWVDDTNAVLPGTNTHGLSFVGSGYLYGTSFEAHGLYGFMWHSGQDNEQNYLVIQGQQNHLLIHAYNALEVYLPVRCIKGDGIPVFSSSSSALSSSSSSIVSSSSSSVQSSSSSQIIKKVNPSLKEKGEQFNPSIDYGTMTDSRDGKTYRTVVVNGQTWMAENLNYAGNEIGKSYCFNNDEKLCELYGRFYSRDAAMNSSICTFGSTCSLGSDPIQGVCPSGWHIPSFFEALDLVDLVDSNASLLRSAKGWGIEDSIHIDPGSDTYGLSFVGSGAYDTKFNFYDLDTYAFMWLYQQSYEMCYLLIRGEANEAYVNIFKDFEANYPVRCIKDE